MNIVQAIILGIVQGLTEFLPVSSSGHLVLIESWLGLEVGKLLDFDVAVHAGTFLALVVYFWKDLMGVLRDLPSPARWKRLVIPLVLGTIPAVILGFTLKDWIEDNARSPLFVALMLILTGFMLIGSDLAERWMVRRKEENMCWWQSITVGVFQALALIPGISRSGSTLTGGVFVGLSKIAAARFSFLLGMVAILGATILTLPDALASQSFSYMDLGVGFVAAFLSGLLAVWGFLKLITRIPLFYFSIYLFIVAGSILAFG